MLNVRPRIIIVNSIMIMLLLSGVGAEWFLGLFSLKLAEYAMLIFLFGYFAIGSIASWFQNWHIVRHIANGLPMWALAFTGIGIINASLGLTNTTPEIMITVFKNLALAIAPNIVGVLLMIWLREIALWCGHEET